MRPRLLVAAVVTAVCVPVLGPDVQLFWRDTQRFFYPFKLVMAERLRRGELPLWDPWTGGGVSVLGQLTPAPLHPATLLYLALPFPLAFKLNHLLALALAACGAFLLARRLGAGPWAASIAATTYAASGFLCSMAASNLPFALGHGTLPLAIWALIRFVDEPRPATLWVAALVLASCGLAGEPQSMLLAGLIAFAWALRAPLRGAPRRVALLAVCGALGALLSAPATFPAAARLRLADRQRLEHARGVFALDARRLPGLALPWAFDDTPEQAGPGESDTPYSEYFSGPPHVAFADSIALGAPALVLAAFSSPALLAGALLLLLAALGPATPVEWIAAHAIPGFALFRYAEKMVGPACLLLSIGAALGAERIADGRTSRRFSTAAVAAVLAFAAVAAAIAVRGEALAAWLVHHGHAHARGPGPIFVASLGRACAVEALLVAALAGAARLRFAPAAVALVCAASAYVCGAGRLVTAPRELLESRPALADLLESRAGPSAGAWRIDSDTDRSLVLPGLDARLRRAAWSAQVLAPRTNAVQRIESIDDYGSLEDEACERAQAAAPEAIRTLLGARFVVRMPWERAVPGSFEGPFGTRIRERPIAPRAFLVSHAAPSASMGEAIARLRAPAFDPLREAVTDGDALDDSGEPAMVELRRERPERMRASVAAPGRRLLVLSERYDPGWRARIDGAEAQPVRVDLCALGVAVPPGTHEVELRFVPVGLWPGLLAAAAGVCVLALFSARRYRSAAAR